MTRRQLLAAGFTAKQIRLRIENGILLPVHPGVYRVGHRAPSVEATYLAAVGACGDGALLSGRAAAYLWGLVKGPPPAPEVTAPTERKVRGVRTRRSAKVCVEEAGRFKGIPITTVPRTLVDLASTLAAGELARACHEAGVKHRTTPRQVAAVLDGQPGAAKLRSILLGDTRVTLSRLEQEFLRLLQAAGLPLPVTNRPAGAHRVDCRWPDHRLTVELDSYTFHSSRHAWEQDRRREREARRRGDDFRRFTYDDVFRRAAAVVAELTTAL